MRGTSWCCFRIGSTLRVDFRWLAEGQTADHTTLSEFRRNFREELKGLFVQTGVISQELGVLSLKQLAFDLRPVRNAL